ncbi:hypothetical protein R1flu_020383 [Riccia fluitans]|uniref:Uncharacterized protein n=1 Tax=Riccia fluitans TaxID=41844 RepID=A0ABD1ZLR4_9MARC
MTVTAIHPGDHENAARCRFNTKPAHEWELSADRVDRDVTAVLEFAERGFFSRLVGDGAELRTAPTDDGVTFRPSVEAEFSPGLTNPKLIDTIWECRGRGGWGARVVNRIPSLGDSELSLNGRLFTHSARQQRALRARELPVRRLNSLSRPRRSFDTRYCVCSLPPPLGTFSIANTQLGLISQVECNCRFASGESPSSTRVPTITRLGENVLSAERRPGFIPAFCLRDLPGRWALDLFHHVGLRVISVRVPFVIDFGSGTGQFGRLLNVPRCLRQFVSTFRFTHCVSADRALPWQRGSGHALSNSFRS